MDNITHGLAGALVAEGAALVRARRTGLRDEPFRVTAYVTSIAANNVGDFDFLYQRITEGALGYLLHHRGHTHTIVAAIPLGILSLAFAWVVALLTWRRRPNWRRSWPWLAALAAVGPVLHIAMDASNNYGVHPFWPLDARWFYGDTIFIVEPFFWATTIPALLLNARSKVMRVILAALLAGGIALTWTTGHVPYALAAVVTLVAAVGVVLVNVPALGRVMVALAASLFVLATFAASSAAARAEVLAQSARSFPAARTHDVVLTPLPGTPLCWSVILVQTVDDYEYVLRTATVALAPGFLDVTRCGSEPSTDRTAEVQRVTEASTAYVRFDLEFRAPLAELRGLATRCDVHAFLRFSRTPFWVRRDERIVVGDLRYDSTRGLDFAEMAVPARLRRCPEAIPPWTPPREHLLQP